MDKEPTTKNNPSKDKKPSVLTYFNRDSKGSLILGSGFAQNIETSTPNEIVRNDNYKKFSDYEDSFGYASEKTEVWIARTFNNGKIVTVTKNLESGKVECCCIQEYWDRGRFILDTKEEPTDALLYKLEKFIQKKGN
jgi:hypothetical protein